MSTPPLPPTGAFISTSRTSSCTLRQASGIRLSLPSIRSFLGSLDEASFTKLKSSHGLRLPLQFPDLQQEVNFLSLLSLFNFLSAYRAPLHHHTGSGAWETILKLFISLYISPPTASSIPLSSKSLQSISHEQIASILSLPLHSEAPHPTIEGLVIGTPKTGDGWEIVDLLYQTLQETGQRLDEMGKVDLGQLVLEILNEAHLKSQDEGEKAEYFVEKLVTSIPGFLDASLVPSPPGPSLPVYLFKKAYFLLLSLSQRLSTSSSSQVKPIDVYKAKLPMFVDNVIPTMLLRFGILDLEGSEDESLRKWGEEMRDFVAKEEEVERMGGETEKESTSTPSPNAKTNAKDKDNAVKEGPRLSEASAYRIRAAGLDAGALICQVAREMAEEGDGDGEKTWLRGINEVDLDGYLWSVSKSDKSLRKVPRMAQRGTNMY